MMIVFCIYQICYPVFIFFLYLQKIEGKQYVSIDAVRNQINIMELRHKQFSLQFGNTTIKISSNFDSGNLQDAQIINENLILTPAFDPMNSQYSIKQSSKTFFHFSIQATPSVVVPIVIKNMRILEYFANEQQFQQYYRICIGRKKKKGWAQQVQYQKMKLQGLRRMEIDGSFQLHFSINIEQQIYLAYHYPYPFQKIQQFLQCLKERVVCINQQTENKIYLTNELLIESLQGRSVNLLTLTSSNNMMEQQELRITKSIFPYYQIQKRPRKFNKPYIFFTCRVHSGETSSSFALQGMVDFLVSKDKRAQILRQNFVFLIIPVLNPDGVYHGTYRMDTLGHNLNRFYNSAQSHKQPAVFAIQMLANYYAGRIVFFMDIHSHPHPNKGSFIYGNCLPQIEDQAETQLYAKILSNQSECFGYNWSNFSTNQMNSRDINELLTKDGSARVQLYKTFNIPFAYTMQLGYHGSPAKKLSEQQFSFRDYKRFDKIFTINDYKEHGKSIMVSLLSLFQINSTNGMKSEMGKYYQTIREQITRDLVQKQQRFRLTDGFVFKKVKIIQELVYNKIYQPIFKKFNFLQGGLVKKGLNQKRNMIHTISENSAGQKGKKQLSLNIRQISKTIQRSNRSKQKGIAAFKSVMESRSQTPRFKLVDSRDGSSLAKMLNLDFNPFPASQRRKMYNVVGNKRTSFKKNIISEIESYNKQKTRMSNYEIDTIDVNSQLQVAQKAYKQIKYEIISTNRNKVLSNFNHNTYLQEEEGVQYNDVNWQSSEKNFGSQKIVLPKINVSNDKTLQNFNMQVQFQKQYQKKYNVKQHKDLTPLHYKAALRNNGLKIKHLIITNK